VALSVRVIVTDASPLIILAAAEALHCLLLPELPVIVPDAVFYEATNATDKVGALHLLDWYRANRSYLRVEPTETLEREITRMAGDGRPFGRDIGERAALECVRREPELGEQGAIALLLSDDKDAVRLFGDPDMVAVLTTSDYLRQLEDARRIQSADQVLQAARQAGLNPSSRDVWSRHDPEVRDAVRAVLDEARARRSDPS
jgi:hypothetical protein